MYSKYDEMRVIKQVMQNYADNQKRQYESTIAMLKEQSNNFIIDITNAKLNIEEAQKQIQVIYNSKHYNWVDKILLIKNNEIIKVYKRN